MSSPTFPSLQMGPANDPRTGLAGQQPLRDGDEAIQDFIDNVLRIIDNFLHFWHDYLIVVTLALWCLTSSYAAIACLIQAYPQGRQ